MYVHVNAEKKFGKQKMKVILVTYGGSGQIHIVVGNKKQLQPYLKYFSHGDMVPVIKQEKSSRFKVQYSNSEYIFTLIKYILNWSM